MELGDLRRDLLSEVFNLGAGRAAASLEELLGGAMEIELSVPRVDILPLDELAARIQTGQESRYCGVQLDHTGGLNGSSVLVYSQTESLRLVQLLLGDAVSELTSAEFTQLHADALLEVGNIVLNACLASVANVLDVEFEADVPSISQGTCEQVLAKGRADGTTCEVFYVQIAFGIAEENLEGHIGLYLDMHAMESLKVHLDRYLKTELGL